jgi:bla regulator protein blaR1
MRICTLLFLTMALRGQEFDVATIKPSDPGSIAKSFKFTPGGGLRTVGSTLRELIETAYDVRQVQIQGGPSWAAQDRYDVTAKAVSEGDADPSTLSDADRQKWTERLRLRTRAPLADRFSLLAHKETRELPIYALNADKNGPRADALKESQSYGGIGLRSGSMTGVGAPMGVLVSILSNLLQRPVVDRTGLIGMYDFTLKWTPDQAAPAAGAPTAEPAEPPSIFTALREQLGLRLDSARGPVEVLVIDRAEKPSEN